MDTNLHGVEPVNLSDILELASWNRERSVDELTNFVVPRHEALDSVDLDLE